MLGLGSRESKMGKRHNAALDAASVKMKRMGNMIVPYINCR